MSNSSIGMSISSTGSSGSISAMAVFYIPILISILPSDIMLFILSGSVYWFCFADVPLIMLLLFYYFPIIFLLLLDFFCIFLAGSSISTIFSCLFFVAVFLIITGSFSSSCSFFCFAEYNLIMFPVHLVSG